MIVALHRWPDGRAGAALVVDGRLEDLLIDAPAPHPAPESVVWARVERVAPALGAAFLSLPGGAKGWLRDPDARPGRMRLVQVARWADPGKAAPLNDRPIWKGRLAILTPGAPGANVARSVRGHETRERLAALGAEGLRGAEPDTGVVLRSEAAEADDDAVLSEIAALRARADAAAAAATGTEPKLLAAAPDAHARALRDWPAAPVAQDWEGPGVWDLIDALRRPRVALPGGGWMSVEATAAMVAVDVNTGEDFSRTAAQTANLAACADLPRQLRLRGLGGVIYLDLAPVRKGARQGVEQALKRAFAADAVETQIAGWTPLGAVEMLRKRERRPLSETLPRD